eukprot:SAG11_NODE_1484_length_4826_cov_4.020309_4_plen_179_part_00
MRNPNGDASDLAQAEFHPASAFTAEKNDDCFLTVSGSLEGSANGAESLSPSVELPAAALLPLLCPNTHAGEAGAVPVADFGRKTFEKKFGLTCAALLVLFVSSAEDDDSAPDALDLKEKGVLPPLPNPAGVLANSPPIGVESASFARFDSCVQVRVRLSDGVGRANPSEIAAYRLQAV